MMKYLMATVLFICSACVGAGGWDGSYNSNRAPNETHISPQDILSFVHDTVNTLNDKINKVSQTQVMLESVVGPLDANNDGIVSQDEAKAAGARLAASENPKAADLLMDPDVWLLLGGSYMGFHGLKSGGVTAARSLLSKLATHVNDLNNNGIDDDKELPPKA